MKNEAKIRRLLDYEKFHLGTSNTGEWGLYRKYDDFEMYISPENKPIMTNETHTEKDLLKFAKKHREIDLHLVNNVIRLVICLILLSLCIVNLFIRNIVLRRIILIANLVVLIWAFTDHKIFLHNHKIIMEELKEEFELRKKIIESKKDKE